MGNLKTVHPITTKKVNTKEEDCKKSNCDKKSIKESLVDKEFRKTMSKERLIMFPGCLLARATYPVKHGPIVVGLTNFVPWLIARQSELPGITELKC